MSQYTMAASTRQHLLLKLLKPFRFRFRIRLSKIFKAARLLRISMAFASRWVLNSISITAQVQEKYGIFTPHQDECRATALPKSMDDLVLLCILLEPLPSQAPYLFCKFSYSPTPDCGCVRAFVGTKVPYRVRSRNTW